jgi:hypothetical protein
MQIKNTGELIYPTGQMYYPKTITLQPMDRVIITNSAGVTKGIEYVIEAVYPSYIMSGIVDHYEANFHLPI